MQKKFCARINIFHRLLGYPWTMMNNLDRLTESQLFNVMIDISYIYIYIYVIRYVHIENVSLNQL